jgi:hypothetical protein
LVRAETPIEKLYLGRAAPLPAAGASCNRLIKPARWQCEGMATYRVIGPEGEVDAKEIESAADAYALFVDAKADNSEGWRMEVKHNGGDAFLR